MIGPPNMRIHSKKTNMLSYGKLILLEIKLKNAILNKYHKLTPITNLKSKMLSITMP